MKTYYVLTHAEKESKAIKDGFSWPAFFFPIPWALMKGLFGVAFMLFLTWVVLFSISYGIMVIAPEASSWLSLIFLLAKIVAGNLANDWLKEKLCESGYVLERKVEAKRPSQAIAALSNHPTIWIDPTIPLLGSKKESNQTSLIGGSPDAGGGKKSSGMIRILVGTAVLVLCVFGLNAAFKHYDRERTIREGQEIEYTLRIAWNERDVELAKSALQNDAWRYIPSGPSALSDLLALSIYENEIAFVDLLTSFIGNLDTRSVWSSVIRDFDTRMYGKMPPLHQAAYLGRPRIVELLLERGADAEKHWGEDEDSLTPLEFSLLPSRDEAADLEGKKQAAGILRDWIAPPNRPSLQQQSSTDSGKSEDSPSLQNKELADQSFNAKIEAIEAMLNGKKTWGVNEMKAMIENAERTEMNAFLDSEPSAKPLPETGERFFSPYHPLFSLSGERMPDDRAPLRIQVPNHGEHYYIKVINRSNSAGDEYLFIRSGDTAEIKVPLGMYDIVYAVGKTWRGEFGLNAYFGKNTVFYRCKDIFHFRREKDGLRGYEIELQRQLNGNLETERIDAEDFF